MWWCSACSMTGLDRREAGAAGDEDDRLVGFLAQVERAERPLEAQDLAPLVTRLNSWSVNRPPGTCRMCSSSSASSCGAVASEKLRRRPSFSRKSMYWPARYCSRSLAGSLSVTIATSGAGFSIDSIAAGQLADLDVAGAPHFAHLDRRGRSSVSRSRRARARRASRRRSASPAGARRSRPRRRGSGPCTCRRRRCGSRTESSGRRASPPRARCRRSSQTNEWSLGFMVIWYARSVRVCTRRSSSRNEA